jgi:hypothetical protein
LKRKGIDTTQSRFTDIVDLKRIVLDHQKRNDIQRLLNTNYNEQLKYVFALIEGFAFAEICDAFKEEKNHILNKSKLEKMIEGPFFSWDEPFAGDNARNTQFEFGDALFF